MAKILIVDDEASIRRTLRDILEYEKYEVEETKNGLECLVKLKKENYDVVIMDIKMPKMDGIEALERVQLITPDTPVIMISGHANIDSAVEAVKKGAFDFISKPPDLNRLLITIRNAIDRASLVTEKKVLQRKVARYKTQDIIGKSSIMEKIRETIDRVSPTDARILITGANGTGKELVARWIHEKSNRSDFPIVEVNCAAIPAELIESELFGHEKGSFTSAVKQRIGKFEQANGGTLFLDEIGDMSLSAQAKVLRALQESQISRVGGDKSITVDVRVIAATNKDLQKEIAKGRFREDLYHRLAVIIVHVPALSKRIEDIPLLVDHFNQEICHDYGIQPKKFSKEALQALQEFEWSGNIRELRNVVERLIILSGASVSKMDVCNYVIPSSGRDMYAKRTPTIFDKIDDVDELHQLIDQAYSSYKTKSRS